MKTHAMRPQHVYRFEDAGKAGPFGHEVARAGEKYP
jgi:hypothetical protein